MCCITKERTRKLSTGITLLATKELIEMLERVLQLPDEHLREALQIERDASKEFVQELMSR